MKAITPFILEYPELSSMQVMTVGDFHIGDKHHSKQELQSIVDWVVAEDDRFITIDGDIFNAAIKSSISDVYTEDYTLQECMELFEQFIDDVTPEKILVCIDGNHDQRIWNAVGFDPVLMCCRNKGVRYSSGEAFVTVKLGCWDKKKKGKKRMVMYTIYVTHGVGGGRSSGGKLNSLMRLAEIVQADIYVQGHQHDPVIKPRRTLRFSSQGNSVVEHEQMFVVTGSCLERGGYAVAKAYPPVCTKSPIVTLDGTRKNIQASI